MTRPDNTGSGRTGEDAFLEALFEEERGARAPATSDAPEVPPALLARVLADAEAVQAGFDTAALPARRAAPRPGLWAQLGAALGGWPAFAGLAAVSVCGLLVGLSPPQGLSDTAAYYTMEETALYDPVSGFDFDLGES